jgi:hypothetical protein
MAGGEGAVALIAPAERAEIASSRQKRQNARKLAV